MQYCTNLISIDNALPPTVTDLSNMLSLFDSNLDISQLNVSKVLIMNNMFHDNHTFNQDISGWDVSNVTNMSYMFKGATAFDQDIGGEFGWDVSRVKNMEQLFQQSGFNQNISSWNVSGVTIMYNMFFGASAFDQPLEWGSLNENVSMVGMLDGCDMSPANYTATLIDFANNSNVSNITLDAVDLKYTASGANARNTLTTPPRSWDITDAGKVV